MKKRILERVGHAGSLSEDQIVFLINNFNFSGHELFASEEEIRAAWFGNREKLLARRAAAADFSSYWNGERPWAWWRYEAPESRRQVAGAPIKPIGNEMYRGIPSKWESKPTGVRFETEYVYLKRLKLLFPGEDELVRDAEKGPFAGV